MLTDCFIKSSVEASKKRNIPKILAQYCAEIGLLIDITATDVERDWIDKIIGRKREYIQFRVEGTEEKLGLLKEKLFKLI
jgi:hypothetical protein